MPALKADSLAFSPNDSVIALLESTLDAPGRDKSLKLTQRAKELERSIRAHSCDTASVVPVLVAGSLYADISNAVKELCDSDGLVLVSIDMLRELFEMIARGASDAEIQKALPDALRTQNATERLLSRIF